MGWRLMLTAVLSALLLFSGGCSKRRKMIEQYQAQIAQCDKEIDEIVNDDEWRAERDDVMSSLAKEIQNDEVQKTICKNIQEDLLPKYSQIKHKITPDLIMAVCFKDMTAMFQAFSEEPAIAKDLVANDMKKKIEKDIGAKNIFEIMTMLEEQYPMYRISDREKGVEGDSVSFFRVLGSRRLVEGRLNSVLPNGAKFGTIYCPFDDMPDEIAARIRIDSRKRFFRMKAAEIQLEQNAAISKKQYEELPKRLLECGYLPMPSKIETSRDLSNANNWCSKHFLLEQASKKYLSEQMTSKNYKYTEVLPENGKEWIPDNLWERICDLQTQKQVLLSNLQQLKKKRR